MAKNVWFADTAPVESRIGSLRTPQRRNKSGLRQLLYTGLVASLLVGSPIGVSAQSNPSACTDPLEGGSFIVDCSSCPATSQAACLGVLTISDVHYAYPHKLPSTALAGLITLNFENLNEIGLVDGYLSVVLFSENTALTPTVLAQNVPIENDSSSPDGLPGAVSAVTPFAPFGQVFPNSQIVNTLHPGPSSRLAVSVVSSDPLSAAE